MAETIATLSPGVFTKETDQSFLAGNIPQIGAAIIGPTTKGPALIPTPITSYSDFIAKFGSFTDDSYVPFVVNDYLRNGNVITVTRLLYEDGYYLQNGALAIIAKSGSGAGAVQIVTHVLHPTQPIAYSTAGGNLFEDSVLLNDASGSFVLKLSGSYTTTTIPGFSAFLVAEGAGISGSIDSSNNKYLSKTFGTSPKSTSYPVYVQYENYDAISAFANPGAVTMELAKLSNYEFLQDYTNASTPWITSQKVGSVTTNLFKFHTLSHGNSVNFETKIGIRDVRTADESSDPNGYGSFTVEIRRVNNLSPTPGITNSPYSSNDTDSTPDIVEIFTNVNLNPNSSRYIAKVIGDQYLEFNANTNDIEPKNSYPNNSKYVRVEVTGDVATGALNKTLIPFGFRAPSSPMPMASGSLNLKAVSYKTSQVVSNIFNANNYFGFDYTNQNNINYLAPTPTSGSTTGSNADFYLGDASQAAQAGFPTISTAYSGSIETALIAGTLTDNVAISTRKFMVPFQGGFDGTRPNLPKFAGANITAANTFGFDCSTSTSTGTTAYNKAFSILDNTDYYNFDLLITPGIIDSLHSSVSTLARNLVQTRKDSFYVMDSNALEDSISTVVNQVTTIDNNYTAAYWPWVKINNPNNNTPLWVPPSVVIPGVLAYNDRVAAPWYAPAGLNRGGLTSVSDTYKRLSQSDRDTLYQARVNPIANFPNEGVCVWGQKTLQQQASALDRVNVRRLLIAVKRFISNSSKYLVFEGNTNALRKRFESIVNPYMESVRAQQGLYAFRVVIDQSNNTNITIDRNELNASIFLQPTRTAEFIILDFVIEPTGATFTA